MKITAFEPEPKLAMEFVLGEPVIRRTVVFDIETTPIRLGSTPKIICAAVSLDGAEPTLHHAVKEDGSPNNIPMSSHEVEAFLLYLESWVEQGWDLAGWNSLGFDLRVLGEYSGNIPLAASLAMDHYDPMFQFLCINGFPVSLEAALVGMGLSGKVKEVTLNDGTTANGSIGSQASELWFRGECNAVLEYLKSDVLETTKVIKSIRETRFLYWITKNGKPRHTFFQNLLTVNDCLSFIRVPNTSWMDIPITRESFYAWTKS